MMHQDEYEIEEKRNQLIRGGIEGIELDNSGEKYNSKQLISGIMMKGSPTFLSKEFDDFNLASRNVNWRLGNPGVNFGISSYGYSQSMLRS